MLLTTQLNTPGEHPFTFTGAQGHNLEGILTVPEQIRQQTVVLLGHPHSLQGGTMNNKVVTTLARTFQALGMPVLRFNFRGVGHSEGEYDGGLGESDDMLTLLDLWQSEQEAYRCIFAGFSFGSYVAYKSAGQRPHDALISIAPPIHHYNYLEYNPQPSPWLIVQGNDDEVVPAEVVYDFVKGVKPQPTLIRFEQTGHFFHGKLLDLKKHLTDFLHDQPGLL